MINKSFFRKVFFFAVLFVSTTAVVFAQNVTISGNVYGLSSEKVLLMRKASKNVSFEGPVSGVKITIAGTTLNKTVLTEITGVYSFVLPEKGVYKVSVERQGYSSVTFTINFIDAGLKTYYPATSFMLKKDDNSLNSIGELLIDKAGSLTFNADKSSQKKSNNDVMHSNQILLEKAVDINNSSSANVAKLAGPAVAPKTIYVATKKDTSGLSLNSTDTVIPKENLIMKSVISALIADTAITVDSLRSRIERSRKALALLSPQDKNYAILLAQIRNAENQLKSQELIIELKDKEISASKKVIIYLALFGVFALASVALLLVFLRQRKKHMIVLDEKNKSISRINSKLISSIKYAALIQANFFKDKKVLNKLYPSSFIFNQPKDMLSGDFYWFSHVNGHRVVVVADCTGHGVPGALLTILGHNILEEIVNVQGETRPSKILMSLNKAIMSAFSRSEQLEYGMDITVISSKDGSNEVLFSGMTNGLYHYRKNSLTYYSVTAKTIGSSVGENDLSDQSIQLAKGDCLYMFSDGYCDQFGERTDVIEKYNVKRLEQLLTRISEENSFSDSELILKSELDSWKGAREQIDDVLVLGIRID